MAIVCPVHLYPWDWSALRLHSAAQAEVV